MEPSSNRMVDGTHQHQRRTAGGNSPARSSSSCHCCSRWVLCASTCTIFFVVSFSVYSSLRCNIPDSLGAIPYYTRTPTSQSAGSSSARDLSLPPRLPRRPRERTSVVSHNFSCDHRRQQYRYLFNGHSHIYQLGSEFGRVVCGIPFEREVRTDEFRQSPNSSVFLTMDGHLTRADLDPVGAPSPSNEERNISSDDNRKQPSSRYDVIVTGIGLWDMWFTNTEAKVIHSRMKSRLKWVSGLLDKAGGEEEQKNSFSRTIIVYLTHYHQQPRLQLYRNRLCWRENLTVLPYNAAVELAAGEVQEDFDQEQQNVRILLLDIYNVTRDRLDAFRDYTVDGHHLEPHIRVALVKALWRNKNLPGSCDHLPVLSANESYDFVPDQLLRPPVSVDDEEGRARLEAQMLMGYTASRPTAGDVEEWKWPNRPRCEAHLENSSSYFHVGRYLDTRPGWYQHWESFAPKLAGFYLNEYLALEEAATRETRELVGGRAPLPPILRLQLIFDTCTLGSGLDQYENCSRLIGLEGTDSYIPDWAPAPPNFELALEKWRQSNSFPKCLCSGSHELAGDHNTLNPESEHRHRRQLIGEIGSTRIASHCTTRFFQLKLFLRCGVASSRCRGHTKTLQDQFGALLGEKFPD